MKETEKDKRWGVGLPTRRCPHKRAKDGGHEIPRDAEWVPDPEGSRMSRSCN